jgi:poly(A) polymerase Pap1
MCVLSEAQRQFDGWSSVIKVEFIQISLDLIRERLRCGRELALLTIDARRTELLHGLGEKSNQEKLRL